MVASATGEEIASGTDGLAAMVAALDETKVLFGAIRVLGVDEQENVTSSRPKIVRVNWVGTKVPAMKKMGALQGKAKIAEIWNGSAGEVDANKPEEIDMNTVGCMLLASGGAHKPTKYVFGPSEEIPLTEVKNTA